MQKIISKGKLLMVQPKNFDPCIQRCILKAP